MKLVPFMKVSENFSKNLPYYFEQQYQLIQASRKLLLDYCTTISNEDFIKTNSGFGIASIRDLLVHIANSYQAWLGRALKNETFPVPYEKVPSIKEAEQLFCTVDEMMVQFFELVAKENPKTLGVLRNGETLQLKPLRLFSHVITHEFHHKGQILSLSRHLGYIPVDTDIIP